MKIIYIVKQSKYGSTPALAATTIEDAVELAKALGMEPDEEYTEWVGTIPLIGGESDDA